MICKNCGKEFSGNFCPHCGQSATIEKINLPNFIEEFTNTVFQINKGLPFTIKELFVRPGHAIRDFVEGKRKNYFKPIAYAFLLSTVYYFLSKYLGKETLINSVIGGFSRGISENIDNETFVQSIFNWLINNHAYTSLILIPFYSLSSYLSFFNKGLNYLEHFVLNAYIVGQQAIIYMFFIIISTIFDEDYYLEILMVIIAVIYAYWVFRQFFIKIKKVEITLRVAFTYFLNFFFINIILSGFALIAIIISKVFN